MIRDQPATRGARRASRSLHWPPPRCSRSASPTLLIAPAVYIVYSHDDWSESRNFRAAAGVLLVLCSLGLLLLLLLRLAAVAANELVLHRLLQPLPLATAVGAPVPAVTRVCPRDRLRCVAAIPR